jgi:rhodanese-related sulfurtransferase
MSTLFDTATRRAEGYRDVDPSQVAARAGLRVVDVREPNEYTGELGHIPGAELVPLGALESAAATWDKDRELVLVCRSGARSSRAAATLAAAGFRRVMNMTGGMLAWNAARLPVSR